MCKYIKIMLLRGNAILIELEDSLPNKFQLFAKFASSSSGSGGGARGPGPPLAPIFEAPDYILRPKLHLFTLK